MTLHALASVALVVLAALVVGRLLRRRAPELVGYVLVGALLGPGGAGLFGTSELHTLQPLLMVPVGFLMFLIGERISAASMRETPWMAVLAPLSYALTAAIVFVVATAAGASFVLAAMLAVLGGSGAPMTVASVVDGACPQSAHGRGLIGLHASCDALAGAAFAIVFPLVELSAGAAGRHGSMVAQVLRLGLAGVAVGGLFGLSLSAFCRGCASDGRLTALALTHVAALIALTMWLDLSVPLAALAMGAVAASRIQPAASTQIFERLRAPMPALFLLYSTLAGAAIRLEALPAMGLIGLAYVVSRTVGKLAGAQLAAKPAGIDRRAALRLGLGSLPHAGIAVGLATVASGVFPGRGIATIPLSGVVLFEIVGALIVRSQIVGRKRAPRTRRARGARLAPAPTLVPAPATALEPAA